MTRQLFSLCLASCLLVSLPPARAEEYAGSRGRPVEMKIVEADVGLPRDDDAALHRRDHGAGDERGVLADVEGGLRRDGISRRPRPVMSAITSAPSAASR